MTREEAPKAESTLTHTIRSHVVGELQRMITSSLRYNGLVVQETGGQGVPPVQSILDWVRVKRIQPKTPKADQRDLAFIIARSIARKGTPANDFTIEQPNKLKILSTGYCSVLLKKVCVRLAFDNERFP